MIPADFPFDPYPIPILIGFVLALVVLELFYRRIHAPKGCATDYEICIVIAGAFGFLFAILFQNFYDFIESPSTYHWTWAMTFLGGLIGGVGSFFIEWAIYLRKKYPGTLDKIVAVAGAAIPLAHGFGRIGCILDGCCYGSPITEDSPFYWIGVEFRTTPGKKVWPTQIFECVFLFVLATVLLILLFKKYSKLTMPIYLISYGLFRFLNEFLRGDHRGSLIPGLSPSQFWCLLLFLGGVVYLVLMIQRKDFTITPYPVEAEKEEKTQKQ